MSAVEDPHSFGHYDPADERRREALFCLGNGVLSWRASAPECAAAPQPRHPAAHYAGFYRAGWYDDAPRPDAPRQPDGSPTALGALVNLPDPFGLSIRLGDGAWFDLDTADLLDYRQTLEPRLGQLRRRARFVLDGHELTLHEERFVSMARADLAALRWTLEATAPLPPLTVRATLNGGTVNALVERNHAYEGRRLDVLSLEGDASGGASLVATLPSSGRRLGLACRVRLEAPEVDWHVRQVGACLVQETHCEWPGNGRLRMEKLVVAKVDEELPDGTLPVQEALLRALPEEPYEALRQTHRQAWATLWAEASLETPDPTLQALLDLAVFHLLQAVSPLSVGRDQGLPPRGWQEGYFGQIFWDELFAFPFLATRFPAFARSLLGYRHRRLDKARERARRAGLRGALYPWRSARDGDEETPPYQYNPLSGRWMRDHTYLQRHIGAAIVYDVWQLYRATVDEDLLAGEGGDLILEIARFWASLARHDEARQRFVIQGVLGPDEYHSGYPGAAEPGLDNNAYTNLMAAWCLCRGLDVLERLPAPRAEALRERLGLEADEPTQWEAISRSLYLPFQADGLLDPFDGFRTLEPPPRVARRDDEPRLDWLLESRYDTCNRYQIAKQPDVLMLPYLFAPEELRGLFQRLGYSPDPEAERRTLAFHLARLAHESSLSKMVCAGALAEAEPSLAWTCFQECLRVDVDARADSGTREGVHLGALAGALDVLQRHYLGLTPTLDGLRIAPSPPRELPDLCLTLRYRGDRVRVSWRARRLTLDLDARAAAPLAILHPGGRASLAPGQSWTLAERAS